MNNLEKFLGRLPQGRPLGIAHRGARSLAPENTLAAARAALRCRADMWELDVALSADGAPVVVHDDTLARTSDVAGREEFAAREPWPVGAFTLAELKSLDFGSWFVETDPFGCLASGDISLDDAAGFRGEQIPTLEEALLITRDNYWLVNVEIKDLKGGPGEGEIIFSVMDLIAGLGLLDRVIVSSFNLDYVARVREARPEAVTAALADKDLGDPVRVLKNTGAAAYHPYVELVSPPETARLRELGYLVNVWTVNDREKMSELTGNGVTGLITDFPQYLTERK